MILSYVIFHISLFIITSNTINYFLFITITKVNYNEAIKITKEYVLNDSSLKNTFIENWKAIFAENDFYLNNEYLINKVFTSFLMILVKKHSFMKLLRVRNEVQNN